MQSVFLSSLATSTLIDDNSRFRAEGVPRALPERTLQDQTWGLQTRPLGPLSRLRSELRAPGPPFWAYRAKGYDRPRAVSSRQSQAGWESNSANIVRKSKQQRCQKQCEVSKAACSKKIATCSP